MKRELTAAAGGAGVWFSVAACGGDGGDGKSTGANGYAGWTLTVWVTDGSSPDQWQKGFATEFETKTKAKVTLEVQQGNGVQQKPATALSEENPPGVFEVGNTRTTAYAKTGGLVDLTELTSESDADRTESLDEPSVFDGEQHAAP